MKIKLAKTFRWSPNGYDINEYQPGEHDVPERCAEVAALSGVLAESEEEPKEEKPISKSKKK